MNMKETYITPTVRIHKLAYNPVMLGEGSQTEETASSKSSFADFGDPSDEAPSSSWDNSAY